METRNLCENNDFWQKGQTCTLIYTGQQGLILDHKRKNTANINEYLVHANNETKWIPEHALLVTGLSNNEQNKLQLHLRCNLELTQTEIQNILNRHNAPTTENQQTAHNLLLKFLYPK